MRKQILNVTDIKPNSWNANKMVGNMPDRLKNSKDWFGDLQDIIVWEKNNELIIIDGEHRWTASKQAGKETIQAKILTTQELIDFADKLKKLSETQERLAPFKFLGNIENNEQKAEFMAKALTIVMNSIKGENNPVKLANLFLDLENKTTADTLIKLFDMENKTLEGYRTLLQMSDKEVKYFKDPVKEEFYELVFVFNQEEIKIVKEAFSKIKGVDYADCIARLCEEYLENDKQSS